MLTGFWYRALPADRVRRNQLHQAMLLEIPLVIGRDRAGYPFALHDACPHRGMPLHCGKFDGENIECSYHGWTFDAHNGQCELIPSLTPDQNLKVDRIYAGSYPCEEQDDFVWVYIPDPGPQGAGFTEPQDAPDAAPQIEKFSNQYKLAYLTADMPVSIDHGIIGLMDPAHGPFVHQAWWWRGRHSIHEKKKTFEPIPNGFRMSAHTPSSNSAPYKLLRLYADADSITTTIDFTSCPTVRTETIRAGKYWFSVAHYGHAHHSQPMPHRRGRRLEHFPLDTLRPRAAEIRLRQIRRAGPPHYGTTSRRAEAQSPSHADR